MAAGEHFVGGRRDGVGLFSVEQAEVAIDHGAGALDGGQCHDQFVRHALGGDGEVLQRTLRLRAPQPFGGDLDGAE